MSAVDPGDGWRLLGENERVEAGDEYLDRGVWCGTKCAGRIVKHMDETYRRRVPAATADAEPSPASRGSQASEIEEDLKSLATRLGFAWPEDDAGRWRVLKTMAGMAAHWRAKYDEVHMETWRGVERERMYQHMRRRAVSLAAKVTNLRRCLRDYMAGQRVAIAEARAELQGWYGSKEGER